MAELFVVDECSPRAVFAVALTASVFDASMFLPLRMRQHRSRHWRLAITSSMCNVACSISFKCRYVTRKSGVELYVERILLHVI